MPRNVSISDHGRSGFVVYRDHSGSLDFHWDFGGGDEVVTLRVTDPAAWANGSAWPIDRRPELLRFVAAEVIRQKAPTCRAEIDEAAGVLHLRQAAPMPVRPSPPAGSGFDWLPRLTLGRGLVVLGVAVSLVGLAGFVRHALQIDPGKGMPIAQALRTERYVATLVRSLEAYVPSLHRDAGQDRYTIRLDLVPLDGSATRQVPLRHGLTASSTPFARLLGSDGRVVWFDVAGIGGVDLGSLQLLPAKAVQQAAPALARSAPGAASWRAQGWQHQRAAGLFVAPDTWLGLHGDAEAARDVRPGRWLKRVQAAATAANAAVPRRLYQGKLDPASADGHQRIRSMAVLGNAAYLDAAFLRRDDRSEPVSLSGPLGALMLFTSRTGPSGTVMLARVDSSGAVRWQVDTGIDRRGLTQILPGERSLVLVGTRLPQPGRVSSPRVVIVDHLSGLVTELAPWQ
jgi:hypothetical protein